MILTRCAATSSAGRWRCRCPCVPSSKNGTARIWRTSASWVAIQRPEAKNVAGTSCDSRKSTSGRSQPGRCRTGQRSNVSATAWQPSGPLRSTVASGAGSCAATVRAQHARPSASAAMLRCTAPSYVAGMRRATRSGFERRPAAYKQDEMAMGTDSLKTRGTLEVGRLRYALHRLDALGSRVERLPFSLRVLLENLLRREDGRSVTRDHV